jgi:hypothetical protein
MDSYDQYPSGTMAAPDPVEQFWLTVSLPDGLYMLPSSSADQRNDQGESAATAMFVILVGLAIVLAVLASV